MIQQDKSKEETQQMSLLHEKLKRVKSDNALFGKNIERMELEKHLNQVDQNERRRQEDKRDKEKQWIDKMSHIEQARPYYQTKYEKIDAFADRHYTNNIVKAKVLAQERVKKQAYENVDMKLANDDQV
jgi:hypothetical protein